MIPPRHVASTQQGRCLGAQTPGWEAAMCAGRGREARPRSVSSARGVAAGAPSRGPWFFSPTRRTAHRESGRPGTGESPARLPLCDTDQRLGLSVLHRLADAAPSGRAPRDPGSGEEPPARPCRAAGSGARPLPVPFRVGPRRRATAARRPYSPGSRSQPSSGRAQRLLCSRPGRAPPLGSPPELLIPMTLSHSWVP